MKGLNKVILIGNLGRDPEIMILDSGIKRAAFSMATTETYKDKLGQKVDVTEWHNIVVWGKLADVAEKYLKKGSQIYLEGKIKNRSYDDKEGIKKYITEIRCDNFIMLGGGRRDDENIEPSDNPENYDQNSSVPAIDNPDDDLPF